MKMRGALSVCMFVAAAAALALGGPASVSAESSVTITPDKAGIFLLRGFDIEDAAALDITVKYDADDSAKLRVVEGPLIAGAMTAINTKVHGTVRFAIVRLAPIRGSGVIATLIFDRKGSFPRKIEVHDARLVDPIRSSHPRARPVIHP